MPGPSPAGPPEGGGEAEDSKVGMLKMLMYEKCKEFGRGKDMFTQDDLLELDVIPGRDLQLLQKVLQSLSNDKLLITMREQAGQVLWKWRPAEEAHKYKECRNDEEMMVYSLIDDCAGDGIWTQTLQKRLNMHDSVLKTCIKHLQSKGLIAPFKSVEHPNKKMYIKASIRPSDRATGGPWYTDQNLDEAFIEELQRVIFDFVKRQSSYRSKHGGEGRAQVPKKGIVKGDPDKGRKRTADDLEEPVSKTTKTSTGSARRDALLPLPAGYTGYPSVRDIARLLSTSGITNNTVLTEEDVKKLVDVLVWDNLLEPVRIAGKIGYRVSRVAKQSTESWAGREDPTGRNGGPEPYVSAFTEAPCGRCPVFDLCEEGGPVGPSNCRYFKKWLEIDPVEEAGGQGTAVVL